MTDEEFQRDLYELTDLVKSLRLIKDKGHRKRMKKEALIQFHRLIKD